jgi:hypothetical protein
VANIDLQFNSIPLQASTFDTTANMVKACVLGASGGIGQVNRDDE